MPLSIFKRQQAGQISCAESGCVIPVGIEEREMQDLTMVLFTVVFFVVAFLYVKACQKLR